MFRNLIVGISMLVASTGALIGNFIHHQAPVRVPHPGFAAAYAAHDVSERSDVLPPAPPPKPPSVQDIISSAFAPLGPGAVSWAQQIAWCESRYDPSAVNTASDAEGLFQFLPSTWAGTPYAGRSPFDPSANAGAAAWLLQKYGPSQWACQA